MVIDDPVNVTVDFEPLEPVLEQQLAGMIEQAFGQSLEALRRCLEQKVAWDA